MGYFRLFIYLYNYTKFYLSLSIILLSTLSKHKLTSRAMLSLHSSHQYYLHTRTVSRLLLVCYQSHQLDYLILLLHHDHESLISQTPSVICTDTFVFPKTHLLPIVSVLCQIFLHQQVSVMHWRCIQSLETMSGKRNINFRSKFYGNEYLKF